ncbi:hypothetical protein TBLA_0A03670 [Henningerozyma blattae CBS 6284]|uniref:Needs CLA4 to survive protein 3 n=1 Tax=Henningerozyma blattae (strain ATCC 34711 / CBS 6284 / DSM 70876 / NBRC 10599 / NRRL Y-10934 / UCD 77-7) TaxID=1071380 RepID=I2GVL3_HENB6|nr:hypothetical protein TBLA_0A03670 [Tetrapisispora blattae CBS 6284]CCH58165.1 hypothetical protein TBLA_0A03670 [Tetrapisispora blattae CBS 6284]
MGDMSISVTEELERVKKENELLRKELNELKKESKHDHKELSLEEYRRYGRQMIVEDFGGLEGQKKLKNANVLVVGAGGLGSPSLPYLVGAGVGHIGIVDNDVVDSSNLHRQVLHDTTKVGVFKCESAKEQLSKLNPNIKIDTYSVRLDAFNAFEIFKDYDVILDCTDTPLARYLISDVAVNLGKTVVSASGLGTEGQVTILNFKNIGPCYRCFYPTPPNPYAVNSCSEGGVIGPCIGLVGTMMAVETLKVLLDIYTIENFKPFLMLYSGFPNQTLRNFKMRGRQSSCQCCGKNPTITKNTIESGEINYSLFCGKRNYNVLEAHERMNVSQFHENYIVNSPSNQVILLDVRPPHHFGISHFDNAINISVPQLTKLNGSFSELQKKLPSLNKNSEVVVLCRYGNDSQVATRMLKDNFGLKNVKDVQGGFFKYIDDIDNSIPQY